MLTRLLLGESLSADSSALPVQPKSEASFFYVSKLRLGKWIAVCYNV